MRRRRDATPHTRRLDDPASAAEELRAVRLKAWAHCQEHMQGMLAYANTAVAGLREVAASHGDGPYPDPAIEAAVAEFRRRADFARRHFVIFAVRGAVLSGRLPEDREPEALERCADDDGLVEFLDEMAQVPIGFVDPPVHPPVPQ